ncbi:MAG: hypothetical protein AAB344_08410 [Bacteroidota bacterium]
MRPVMEDRGKIMHIRDSLEVGDLLLQSGCILLPERITISALPQSPDYPVHGGNDPSPAKKFSPHMAE